MSLVVAAVGWCVAALLALELRRRAGLVADAAHELRGPLTAISLGIEALRRQPVARHRADALANELRRMRVAADDAAAAARGRRAAAAPERFALRPFVEQSGAAWMPAAERRGGRISFDWQGGGSPVRSDPRRLAQAFSNLLANAIEHGGGGIVVRGRPSRGGVRVEIEDRGRGAGSRPNEVSRARGRGLRIARRAIEQAGGRLSAVERADGGRVAVAELPVDRSR